MSRCGDSTTGLAVCSVLPNACGSHSKCWLLTFPVLQQCCDCCSLGLRLRSEGRSCESNINLGYPCSHVMLSCCEGGDHFVHPELKRHPEPVPTVTPKKGECPLVTETLQPRALPHRAFSRVLEGAEHQGLSCFLFRSSTDCLVPKAGWRKQRMCGCFSSLSIPETSLSEELWRCVFKKS